MLTGGCPKRGRENTAVQNVTYTYDASGNRTGLTATGTESYAIEYTYDENNRLTDEDKLIGGVVSDYVLYFYDDNGNLLSRLDTAAGWDTYTYNNLNQLIAATAGGIMATYTYNTRGIRTGKCVEDTNTTFLLDGSNVAAEAENNAVSANYLWGANPIRADRAGSVVRYFLYNAHGDVVQLTDGTGTLQKSYTYDAFGNEKNPSSTDVNPFRYCGEYWDSETGTYYLRARYYDPVIGRFLAEDPAASGLNWYTYCSNCPVSYADPLGLEQLVVTGGAFKSSNTEKHYQFTFVDCALLQISKLNGDATLLVANAGWTNSQYDAITSAARQRNIKLVWLNNIKELENYINTGSTDGTGSRTNDPITGFYLFAHGTNYGTASGGYEIKLGMYSPEDSKFNWSTADISNIKTSSFAPGAESYFYSCRTGNWFNGGTENFAYQWAWQTHGTSHAFIGLVPDLGRSEYTNILGTILQRYGVASKAFKKWRTNRGDITASPGEAWALPTASDGAIWGIFKYPS